MKSKTVFLSELAPVHRALETWRKTRQHRQPIPEDLWMKLAVLARSHGVSPVSQALRLDYYSLKRRVNERMPTSDFVEVKLAPANQPTRGCTAERASPWSHLSGAGWRPHSNSVRPAL